MCFIINTHGAIKRNTALNQTWAARIEKWRLSGLSANGFCEQEGLVYHQFGYWRCLNYLMVIKWPPKYSPTHPLGCVSLLFTERV
ncbi:IS66 family insertion sequence element accessory protein TnpA [Marinomonas sp. IMCC 4694]|uniref:IS66 family insertion sequence element accessory protein TnpA n=1 Tax=Marinomonas sp. IMCC 4694 TaxID=2605432 RepID=UPI003974FC54